MRLFLCFDMFRIDNLGRRYGVRLLFLISVLLYFAFVAFPIGDTNFKPFISWIRNDYPQLSDYSQLSIQTMHISNGNLLYLASVLFFVSVLILICNLYSGLYIMINRPPEKRISIMKFIWRFFVLSFVLILFTIPLAVIFVYFSLVFLFLVPVILLIAPCWLSGDYRFFESFAYSFKLIKGYYWSSFINISMLYGLNYILSSVLSIFNKSQYGAMVVVLSCINIYSVLCLGRYSGILYFETNRPRIHRNKQINNNQ